MTKQSKPGKQEALGSTTRSVFGVPSASTEETRRVLATDAFRLVTVEMNLRPWMYWRRRQAP